MKLTLVASLSSTGLYIVTDSTNNKKIMAGVKYKYVEMSKKYRYVKKVMDEHGNYFWATTLTGNVFETEREAAKMRIEMI